MNPRVAASPETKELLIASLARFSDPETVKFFGEVWDAPARRNASMGQTRQASNARFSRALARAVAGCFILATEDERYLELCFSMEFIRFRPYSMMTHRKFEALAAAGHVGDKNGWLRLWSRSIERFIDVAVDIQRMTDEELLVGYSMSGLMGASALLFGAEFSDHWRSAWHEAVRRGLLDNPIFTGNLALIGNFTGNGDAYLEWQLDPAVQQAEKSHLLCFARNDYGEDILENLCLLIRGEPCSPIQCLNPAHPISTLNHLFGFLSWSTRKNTFFASPSMVLAVLEWIRLGIEILGELVETEVVRERDLISVERSLDKLLKIQVMEKSRFYQIHDELPEGPLKQRLAELWNEDYTKQLR